MAETTRMLATRSADGAVTISPQPLRVQWRFTDASSSDSHMLVVQVGCSVRALPEELERRMLAETLLSQRDAVSGADLAAHFFPSLRDAVFKTIEQRPAEQWTGDASTPMIVEAIRAAAKPVAFNCGVELLPPFEVHVESPTLQREKIESMQRKQSERRTAGQVQHVQRAAELLKQFQLLRDAAPALTPGQLLERVNPADRGSMLDTLLLAEEGARTQTLWVVAGPNLVRIDPHLTPATTEMIPLPSELGPLRSVQRGEIAGLDKLLVGAQSGVIVVDPQHRGEAQVYCDSGVGSQLGFNSVAASGETIWASHGDAGAVGWRIGETSRPFFTARPIGEHGDGPKSMVALGSRLFYCAGPNLLSISRDGTEALAKSFVGAAIVFVGAFDERIIAVRSDGRIDNVDPATLDVTHSEWRCGEVCSAGTLPWLGSRRLLLASVDGPVYCVGADDTLVTQYASVHRGLRAIEGATDMIAGLSSDRQRLVIWQSWDGRRPVAEVHIAGIAKHRVADVCFA